jgi:ferric-dicitrate binding protein FerR (iron transport regulator)
MPEISEEMILENRSSEPRMFELPDGSSVRLEASSEIHFAKGFHSGKREVYLTGKAFFDIVKEPTRPFYVYSGSIVTWVLGTTFYVDAPANARKVEVEVVTGRVSVFQRTARPSSKSENQSSTNGVILSPNQRVEYFIEGEGGHWVTGLVEEPVPVKSLDVERLSLVFSNTSMKEVLYEIQERYGIEVVTENDKIEACAFTGDVSRMSLYDMLSVISNSIGSTYEVKGTRILIGGPGCN